MRFVFVESSLELVPEELKNHPDVVRNAKRRKKKPDKMILDDSLHFRAMGNLENREKRGRPDIIHQCLLALLDSNLRNFEILVHTIDGKIIWIDMETRIPRNYNRFIGLMEDLFEKKKIIANGKTLIEIRNLSLSDILTDNTVVLKEGFSEENLLDNVKNNLTVCIGAFPHGDYSDKVMDVFRKVNARFAGFGQEAKTSLYATYKTVCLLERSG